MNKTLKIVTVLIWCIAALVGSYVLGHIHGTNFGAAQMARHLLNPKYETPTFDEIAKRQR